VDSKSRFSLISKKILGRLYRIAFRGNSFQALLKYYLVIIVIGGVLLYLPFSLESGRRVIDNVNSYDYKFVHSLFTSASAFSDTGLSIGVTKSTFSPLGQVFILILVQLGGLGYTTIKLLI
jgi:trk system potassium uptake protein TrkH